MVNIVKLSKMCDDSALKLIRFSKLLSKQVLQVDNSDSKVYKNARWHRMRNTRTSARTIMYAHI